MIRHISRSLVLVASCLLAAEAGASSGREVTFRVSIAPGAPANYTVRGWLTETGADRPLLLLTAGATESGMVYWDFPGHEVYDDAGSGGRGCGGHGPDYQEWRRRYSLVKYLEDAGIPSLAIDRIGTGESDHPASDQVTIESNVYVLHQVITALRHGSVHGQRYAYSHIIGAGRSLSGPMMDMEAGVNHGLDGLVIQSFAHNPQPLFATFPLALEPAQLEPRFASLPTGYLTTRPASTAEPISPREELFFQPPHAYDPAVMAQEEATKETITDGEINTFFNSFVYSQNVAVPVLNILGEYDGLFCALPDCPTSGMEAGAYPLSPSVEAHVVPGVGHDMNLMFNGPPVAFPLIVSWVNRHFGHGHDDGHGGGDCDDQGHGDHQGHQGGGHH